MCLNIELAVFPWHVLTTAAIWCGHDLVARMWMGLGQGINPLRAKFFQSEHKHVFTFYVIPPHWYDTGT